MAESRTLKVLILSSGQALTSLVGIVSMAVLTRVFSKLDYATYRQTMLAYSFAVPFVSLGLDRALYYFLPGERQRPRALLVENLLLLSMAGMLLSLFILFGGNHLLARRLNNPDLASALLLLAPYPLFMLPAASLSACLMARDRTGQVAAYNVVSRLIMLVLVLLPVLIWTRPDAAIVGTVAGGGATSVVALILMFRACAVGPWRPRLAGMKEQLSYAVPLGLAALLGSVGGSLDQMLVSLRCSPETFAVYSVGAMEIPLIAILTGSITSVVVVDYAQYYRDGRIGDVVSLIHRAMLRSAVFLIPAMVLLLCVAPDLMRFLFGAKYEASAVPFRVYLLLLPMRSLTFGAVLQATGKSRHLFVAAALYLAAKATLGWLGIGWFGPVGAAFSAVMAEYLVFVPYVMTVIRSTLHVPIRQMFPWLELMKITVRAIVPGGPTFALMMMLPLPSVVRLTIGAAVYSGLMLTMLVIGGAVRLSDIMKTPKMLFGTVSRRFGPVVGVSAGPTTTVPEHSPVETVKRADES